MTRTRSLYAMVAAAGVALAALGGVSAAHAHGGVSWSVGIGVPGVVVGATNGYGYPAYPYGAYPPYAYPYSYPYYPFYYGPSFGLSFGYWGGWHHHRHW